MYRSRDEYDLYDPPAPPTTTSPEWWRGDPIPPEQPPLPGFETSENVEPDIVASHELTPWQVVSGLAVWALAFIGEATAWTVFSVWTLAMVASVLGWL